MLRSVAIAALILVGLGSAAQAQSSDAYQLAVLRGSSQLTEIVVREHIASGQTVISVGQQPFIAITEPTPVSPSVYRIYVWETIDNGTTTRAWDCFRLDTMSGRFWHLNFDGTTGSWGEIIAK
jgi:hypothetical protein